MRVVIAGAGSVGRSIARELIRNGHQLLLIDRDADGERVANLVGYGAKAADTRRRPRKTAVSESAPVETHEQVNSTFAVDAPVSRRADAPALVVATRGAEPIGASRSVARHSGL